MSERPGALIGIHNVLTGSASRVPAGPDPGEDPALRERLHVHAVRALEGREAYIHDAILLGRRVRLYTNSHHLADFWRDNWPSEAEWLRKMGQAVVHAPVLTVYAMIGVPAEPPASYISGRHGEVYLFNTSYYGDLRALAMEALGRLPAGHGLRVAHGAAFEIAGRGALLLYPAEVIHPTPTWGLMEQGGVRFLADGWVGLDEAERLAAVEKSLYVRASFVEHYPEYAGRVLPSKFENVPDPTPALIDRGAALAQGILEVALRNDPRQSLGVLPPERAREVLIRLTASREARALLDPAALFGKSRVTPGPLPLHAVFALQAASGEPLRSAGVPGFSARGYEVNAGAVAGHPRELARLIARTAG